MSRKTPRYADPAWIDRLADHALRDLRALTGHYRFARNAPAGVGPHETRDDVWVVIERLRARRKDRPRAR